MKSENLGILEDSESEQRLNKLLKRPLKSFQPPENLTVSEWADKYRVLPREGSAEGGKWRTSRTPYLKEIMDAFTDPTVERIVMVSSSQIGKSEMEINAIGYIIDQDPGPILYIHPTLEEAQKFSTQRFTPMVRDTKVLRRKVASAKRGDARNTKLQKNFPGGLITMIGTSSAAALASAPIRYVICDERDRWERSAGKEGDPFKLAQARQTTFYNRKTLEVSTPTIKGNSPIAESYELGTQEKWCVTCPHCGEYFEVIFKRIHYTKHEMTIAGKEVTMVDDVVEVECPHCGSLSTERQIRKQPHKWIANAPEARKKGIRSFWLNAFSSPWVTWQSICQEYEDAKGDPNKLKAVYNTKFGELWEELGATHGEEYYYERRESYGTLPDGTPIDVPEGPVFLTMGVDVQDNRLESEVVGFGHHKETWGIRKGMIDGSPADSTTWRKLDDVLQRDWVRFNGQRMRIASTCIDSGGHYTTSVYEYCRSQLAFLVFAIKGFGGDGVPFISPFSRVHIGETNRLCRLYKIGVDSGKAAIMTNLCVENRGPGFCHFPSEDDKGYNLRYFTGLLSERIEENEKTGKRRWVKIPGHERNEPLDCRNYALAAFELSHCDTFAAEKRLNELVTEPKPVRNKPKSSPKSRLKRKEFDLYGDF